MARTRTSFPASARVSACVCCAGAALLGASVSLAQGGLKLGEPAEPDTIDLGAPPEPTTGTARPTGPTQPPATQPVPDAPAPPAAPQTSGSGPLAPQVQDGAPLTRESIGDWELACAENGQCAMAQIGNDGEGTPVLEMVIRKLPEPLEVGERTAIAVLDVVTPLGVVLTDGLGLTIDKGPTEAAPFQICTEQGCLVREPIDQDLINRLKRGAKVTIEITAANKGPIASELSLSGFTKGYDTIE